MNIDSNTPENPEERTPEDTPGAEPVMFPEAEVPADEPPAPASGPEEVIDETALAQGVAPEEDIPEEPQEFGPTSDEFVPSNNSEVTTPIFTDKKVNGVFDPAGPYSLPVMEVAPERFRSIITYNTNVDGADTAKARQWQDMLRNSFHISPMQIRMNSKPEPEQSEGAGDLDEQVLRPMEGVIYREGADFQQHLRTEKGKISFATPTFSPGQNLQGQDAVLFVRKTMGRGGLKTIPLVHSGFTVTLNTPSDEELIELRTTLMNEKIELGRQTYGLIFSNMRSYSTSHLLDLVVDNIHSTTLKDWDPVTIRSKIKMQDLDALFWGLACNIWPSGFPYHKALMTKNGIINRDYEVGVVNVNRMWWPDNRSFTERQKAHMSNRQPNQVTQDAIDLYLKDFPLNEGRSIDLYPDEEGNPAIRLILKVPSAAQHIAAGERWIQRLVDIVERTFTDDRDDVRRRNQMISEYASASELRSYSHWIDTIEVAGTVQEDRESMEKMIAAFSEDPEVRDKIYKEIIRYLDDTTYAVIALHESNNEAVGPHRFARLIPIDVINVFFTLTIHRANRIIRGSATR